MITRPSGVIAPRLLVELPPCPVAGVSRVSSATPVAGSTTVPALSRLDIDAMNTRPSRSSRPSVAFVAADAPVNIHVADAVAPGAIAAPYARYGNVLSVPSE